MAISEIYDLYSKIISEALCVSKKSLINVAEILWLIFLSFT